MTLVIPVTVIVPDWETAPDVLFHCATYEYVPLSSQKRIVALVEVWVMRFNLTLH